MPVAVAGCERVTIILGITTTMTSIAAQLPPVPSANEVVETLKQIVTESCARARATNTHAKQNAYATLVPLTW